MNDPSPPYARYAAVYDRIGQRAFGQRTAEALLAGMGARNRLPRRALDLACGTGAATMILAAAGCDTVGVDRAPAMLAEARRAAAAAGLPITWIEQDLRALDVPGLFDLATCWYDSINYLTDADDLRAVFRLVHDHLTPGGLFAFDVNTRHKLRAWGTAAFVAADGDDLFGVYQAAYDESTHLSPLRLTFFARSVTDPGRWDRFDEVHVERGYALVNLEAMLEDAGFLAIDMHDMPILGGGPGGLASEGSMRVLVLARRAESHPIGADDDR